MNAKNPLAEFEQQMQDLGLAETPDNRCAICHRRLTDPVSIARGIGPICITKVRLDELQTDDEEEGWGGIHGQ